MIAFIKLEGIGGFVAALFLIGVGALGALASALLSLSRRRAASAALAALAPWLFVGLSGLAFALAIENWWFGGWVRGRADAAAPVVVGIVLGAALALRWWIGRAGQRRR